MDCCGSSLGGAVAQTVGGCGLSIWVRVAEILMTCQSRTSSGVDLRLAEAAQASRHHSRQRGEGRRSDGRHRFATGELSAPDLITASGSLLLFSNRPALALLTFAGESRNSLCCSARLLTAASVRVCYPH